MSLNSKSLPLSFQYKPKKNIPASKRVSTVFLPSNAGPYRSKNGSSIIRFEIRTEHFLDNKNSYVSFKVTNNEAGIFTMNHSVASLFERVRILSGSKVVSDIQNMNILAHFLKIHSSEGVNKISGIIGSGTEVDGDGITTLTGEQILATASKTYSMEIMSEFLNCKVLPLGVMASAGALTIEFYMCSRPDSLGIYAGPVLNGGLSLSEVEYNASIIEVYDDDVIESIREQYEGDGLYFPATAYESFYNTIPAGATSCSLNIPVRAKSIRSIHTVFLNSANMVNREFDSVSTRVPQINGGDVANLQYHYRVGSQIIPNQSTKGYNNTYLAFQKTQHSELFNTYTSTYCNKPRWRSLFSDTTETGAYSMSLSMQVFNLEGYESGYDNASSSIPLSFVCSGMNMGVECTAITFVNKDLLYKFSSANGLEISL
jgi:hypothetical protein